MLIVQTECENIIALIQNARAQQELSEIPSKIRDTYKLAHVVYHATFIPGHASDTPLLFLTYERDWVDQYLSQDYFRIDPIEIAARTSSLPIDWASIEKHATSASSHFFAEADKYGVGRQGVSIPLIHWTGARGVFTFTANASDRDWEVDKRRKLPELLLIAKHFHTRVIDITSAANTAFKLPSIPLTDRERLCLERLASGYEIKQIAGELYASQTTIRNVLQSASLKLGCTNPYQASTKAVVYGVISGSRLKLQYDSTGKRLK